MKLLSENLELRGIRNSTSSKGNVYYLINCETHDGDPVQFYCKDSKAFPDSLKKGDKVQLTLDYNKQFKSLVVERVDKVGG